MAWRGRLLTGQIQPGIGLMIQSVLDLTHRHADGGGDASLHDGGAARFGNSLTADGFSRIIQTLGQDLVIGKGQERSRSPKVTVVLTVSRSSA